MIKTKDSWEERFDERLDFDWLLDKGGDNMRDKLKDFIKEELERVADFPMGISQWREHGKKNGYYDFFHKQTLAEVKEIVEGMPIHIFASDRSKSYVNLQDLLKKLDEL